MSSRSTIAKKRKAPGMAAILRNVPKGYDWGWYSREDSRMHLQTVDSKNMNVYKVWLEKKGKRVFEPAGPVPGKILSKLESIVKERRRNIEGRWTNTMIEKRWLIMRMRGTLITLIAYPDIPGSRFTRTVDLAEYLPGIYHPDSQMWPKVPVKPEQVTLSPEMAALEIYPEKDESLRHHFFLPTILWED